MKLAKIVTAGSEILKKVSEPIKDITSKDVKDLIETLFNSMRHYNGAGIAAPQIGVSKRIFVYGFKRNPRYPEQNNIEDTVLINPEVLWTSSETNDYYEGCLSLPNIRGLVSRPNKILFSAYSENGEFIKRYAESFEARVILHELDHLNGILFPSRMDDLTTLKYEKAG